jgi:hypothetical protein
MKNFLIIILLLLPMLTFGQKIGTTTGDPNDELQTISLSNDSLYIERANFVLLNSYLDNTNIDTTFLDGRITSLESSITGKLVWADTLSGANRLATGWDIAQLTLGVTSDWSGVTNKPAGFADDIDNVDDADADPTNELFDSTFIDGRISVLEGAGYLTAEVQDLTLVGNTLAISGDPNTDVDLSPYLDNTDTQLNEAQVDAFADNNGYLEWSDTLAISGVGLATFDDLAAVSAGASDGYTQSISYNNGTNNFDVVMASPASSFSYSGSALVDDDELVSVLAARTTDNLTEGATNKYANPNDEIQDLTLVGNTLAISNDPNTDVDLSGYLDDTVLSEATVDSYADNNGYLEWTDTLGNLATLSDITSSEFDSTYLAYRVHLLESTNDVDSVIGNELQNIGWTDVTNYLLITQGTGDFITGFADSTLVATHTDTLGVHTDSITNLHLRIIDVENSTVNDLDIDPTNEVQGLTKVGNLLDISIDADPPIDLSEYRQNLSDVITQGGSAGAKILNLTLGTNPTDAANLQNITNAIATSDALDLDRDTTNEFQNISLAGTNILLKDVYGNTGSTVDLADFAEGSANITGSVSVTGTGSSIVGSPTLHYSKVKQAGGEFLYYVTGNATVSITSNGGNTFTLVINTSYPTSFELSSDAKGVATCWDVNGFGYKCEVSADTGNTEINIDFGTASNVNHDISFHIAYNQ